MAAFCVMVKGPCRGKMCDFWARVRLRKFDTDELVQEIQNTISICEKEIGSTLDEAFSQYWSDFGIKDIKRFCEEDPNLCSKMKQIENRVRMMML